MFVCICVIAETLVMVQNTTNLVFCYHLILFIFLFSINYTLLTIYSTMLKHLSLTTCKVLYYLLFELPSFHCQNGNNYIIYSINT